MTEEKLNEGCALASKIYQLDKLIALDDPMEILKSINGRAEFNEIINPFLNSLKAKLIELKKDLQQLLDAL